MNQAFYAFLSGGMAGSCGIVVSQPFDVIRIRMQTSRSDSHVRTAEAQQPRQSIASVSRNVWQKEGIRGLYKGVGSPVVAAGMRNAFLFASYDTCLKLIGTCPSKAGIHHLALAGAFSGLFACPITTPAELVKVRVQVNVSSCTNVLAQEWQVLKNVVQTRGFRGLFCGAPVTAARDSLFRAIYFPSYEIMARAIHRGNDRRPPPVTMLAGAVAGFVPWTIAYPVDVLKTHWQSEKRFGADTVFRMLRNGLASEGSWWLYRGLGATLLRGATMNAAVLSVYEQLRRIESP